MRKETGKQDASTLPGSGDQAQKLGFGYLLQFAGKRRALLFVGCALSACSLRLHPSHACLS